MSFDGIVLAGGHGRRLGGANKATLTFGARRLLDVAIDALSGARRIVVVGEPVPTTTPVHWTREDPAGGGPVAGLAAGLAFVGSPMVVVLACDLPFVDASHVGLLVAGCREAAAIAVDDDGQDQPLLAAYDTASLRAALPQPAGDASMRSVLATLEQHAALDRVQLTGRRPPTWDCDTAEDLDHARELA